MQTYLAHLYGGFMEAQPEARVLLRRLFFLATTRDWAAEGPPDHVMDQAGAAMAATHEACEHQDYAEAPAQLRVWAGLLGVGERPWGGGTCPKRAQTCALRVDSAHAIAQNGWRAEAAAASTPRPAPSMPVRREEVGAVDERDEDSGSESEGEEAYSSGSDSNEDSSSESESEDEGESPQEFLDRIGAQDHYDEVTSQINPSDDPSLLNEDNKHYFTARALGVRRSMRDGTMDTDEAFGTLSGVVGGQLDEMGVPVPDYSLDPQYGDGQGMSSPRVDGSRSTGIALSPDDFAGQELGREAVSALYHESVHAEQWSLATDVLDGTNTNPSGRVSRLAQEYHDDNAEINARIQGEGGDAYRALPSEQEAFQADGDVGDTYERVGAMHDELEARTAGTRAQLDAEAEERATDVAERTADWQENPLYEPEGGWQNNPLYEQPQGAQ